MKFGRIIAKKIFAMLLIVMAVTVTCPLEVFAIQVDDRYLILDPVSGLNPNLKLYVNKKSMNLDLSKTQNIRVRLKIDDLYSTIDSASSFKINLYELEQDGNKKFISTQNLSISRKHIGNRILSVGVGYFATPTKDILFEVYDTSGNLINSYETELLAYNLGSQVLGGEGVNVGSADCDESDFNDCQLDYLFQRISFEAKPQKQISTRVVKGEDGLYKVTIPVPRTNFKPLGTKIHRRSSTGGNDANGGGTTGGFGETLNISDIALGTSASDAGSIKYDPDADQIVINDNTFFGKDGKVGIGVEDPHAWLDIKAGDANTPPIRLNPGALTTTPIDGAIEYDGDKIYFTKDGVRTELGAQGPIGPSGSQGPIGPQGAVGPQGPAGTSAITIKNGGTLNGALAFGTGYLQNAVLNGNSVLDGVLNILPGSTINGNLNFSSGTINGATFVNSTFTNPNISKLVAPDGSPNPALSVDNNGVVSIGGINPAINSKMYLNGTAASNTLFIQNNQLNPDSSAKYGIGIRSTVGKTISGTSYIRGITVNTGTDYINSGITDNGYRSGFWADTLRANASDNGTLNSIIGFTSVYGHSINAGRNATTSNAIGLNLIPSIGNGTINNSYGIYLSSPAADTGTVNNLYGIYQEHAATKNYFAGNIGLDTRNPQGTLDVNGTLYADNIILNSGGTINGATLLNATFSNPNISKLVAPDGSPNPALSVDNNGNIGIGMVNPLAKLYVNGTAAGSDFAIIEAKDNQLNSDASIRNGILFKSNTQRTSSGISYMRGMDVYTGNDYVASGVTDSGYRVGFWSDTLRQNTLENGNLATIIGFRSAYGHAATIGEGSVTTNVYGLSLVPLAGNGTITNLHDIHLHDYNTTGGTVTNHYAIYQEDGQAKNFFNGNVGIGALNPATKLEVNGTLLAKNIRLASGGTINGATFLNSNISKLVAPDGSPNPALNVDNNGNIIVGNYNFGNTRQVVNIGFTNGNIFSDPVLNNGIRIKNFSTVNGSAAQLVFESAVTGGATAGILGRSVAPDQMALDFYTEKGGLGRTVDLTIDSPSGNVGVGTKTPTAKLDVNGTLLADNIVLNSGGTINGATLLNATFTNPNISKLVAPDGSPNPALNVNNNGNIAIGSPARLDSKLSIKNNDATAGSIIDLQNSALTYTHTRHFNSNGDQKLYTSLNELNNNFTWKTAVANGVLALAIDLATANVGIGALNPTAKLEVNGTLLAKNIRLASGGTINGATIINSNVSKLVSPNGSLDPAFGVDNNGGLTAHWGYRSVIRNVAAENGLAAGDGYRINYEGGVTSGLSGNAANDYLIFDKTDGNDAAPDGGIAFLNTGSDGVRRLSMLITGVGNIGMGVSPNALLTVNGAVSIKESSAPTATATFGKLYANSSNSKLYFQDDSGVSYNLLNGSSASTSSAAGSNTQFQFNDSGIAAGNGALSFTKASKTLAIPSDAPLDINSTAVSIADTDITLDGASTTFTQSTGAITLNPANGSNLNVSLRGISDFTVDTDNFVIDNNGDIGIGTTSPRATSVTNPAYSRMLTVMGRGVDVTGTRGLISVVNDRPVATSSDLLGEYIFASLNNHGTNKVAALVNSGLQGNGGSNGFGAYMGFRTKTDNGDLIEKMRLINSGNLGIGTTNPLAKLEVNGTLLADNIVLSSGGTINGATLLNATFSNPNISKLVAPDGSPNPALSVDNNGHVGIGGTNDIFEAQLSVNGTNAGNTFVVLNHQLNSSGAKFGVSTKSTIGRTINGTSYIRGMNVNTASDYISSGVTDTGYRIGYWGDILRSNTSDNGTLGEIDGFVAVYGHWLDTGNNASTTNAYGLKLVPAIGNGTITNSYGVYLSSAVTGGAVSNYYGIYQQDANAKNYFNGNVGIGTITPNQLLTVNGPMSIKESSAPSLTANFGKLYVNSATSNLSFLDDSGTSYDLLSSGGGGSGSPGGADSQFQFNNTGSFAGNGALTFTKASKTLTIPADAPLDINSTSVSIADTNIAFDGASTTFTQSFGAFNIVPNSGSNVNLTLASGGNFTVNTNQIFFDSNLNRIGLGDSTPEARLDVGGGVLNYIDGTDDLLVKDDVEIDGDLFVGGNINGSFLGTFRVNTNQIYGETGTNWVAIGDSTPAAKLDVGGAIANHVDGTDDLIVKDDVEIDGDLYVGGTINGAFAGNFRVNTNQIYVETGTTWVAIGDSTPAAKLDVGGAIANHVDGTNDLIVADDVEINDDLYVGGNIYNGAFLGNFTVNTNQIYVDSTLSRVGIGDATPEARLDIGGGVPNYIDGTNDLIVKDDVEVDGDLFVGGAINGATLLKVNGNVLAQNIVLSTGITAGGSINGATLTGVLAFKTTSATVNITSIAGVTPSKPIMRIQGSGGAVDIMAIPQIAAGIDGQILVLRGSSNANTVKFDDGDGIDLSSAGSFTLGNKDTLSLIYDAVNSEWVETSRSDN